MNIKTLMIWVLGMTILYISSDVASEMDNMEGMPFDMSFLEATGAGSEVSPTMIVGVETDRPEIRVNGVYSRIAKDRLNLSSDGIEIISISDDNFFEIQLKDRSHVWISSRDVVTDIQSSVELECVDATLGQSEYVQLYGVRGVGEACVDKENHQ